MRGEEFCEQPFWKDPGVIFRNFTLQYVPFCEHQRWNFGVRILLISLIIGGLASMFFGLNGFMVSFFFGLITASVIIFITDMNKKELKKEEKEEKKEERKRSEKKDKWDTYHNLPYIATVDPSKGDANRGFMAVINEPFVSGANYVGGSGSGINYINGGVSQGSAQPFDPTGIVDIDAAPYSGPALPEFTPPTSRNPFMNILLDEIKYNPTRPSAAPVGDPSVKQTFDDYFRVQWFSDPTDVFGKNQSQRQFVTQPSTSVPNDRESYQNWLYKIPGKTCKQGGREACLPSCDGSPVTWLNQDS